MDDLIEALQIFRKYGNPKYPTWCEHDVLNVCDIDMELITTEDQERLDALGFVHDSESESYKSFKFGCA